MNIIATSLQTFKKNTELLIIVLLAIILRLYKIGFQSAWLDEILTLVYTDPNLTTKQANEIISARAGIPHLYFFIGREVSHIFGSDIANIRIISAVFSVGVVIAIYFLAKELFSKKAGLIAALLVAVQPFLIEHGQEGRVYSMLVFFIVLSYYFTVLLINNPNLKNGILLGVSLGFVVNSQPVGLLNIASIFVFLLITILLNPERGYKIKLFKNAFISGIIFLFLFGFAFKIIFKSAQLSDFWTGEATYKQLIVVLENISGRSIYLLSISFIGSLIFFISPFFKKNFKDVRIAYILFLLWIIFNLGGIIVKSFLDVSMLVDRYFIGLIPVFSIILAKVIVDFKNKFIIIALTGLLILGILYQFIFERHYYSSIHKTQFDKLVEYIVDHNINNDKVYSHWAWGLKYYFNKSGFYDVHEVTFEDYIKLLRDQKLPLEPFWYMDGNFRDYNLNKEDQQFLKDHFKLYDSIKMYDTWGNHYVLKKNDLAHKNIEKTNDEIYLNIHDFKGFTTTENKSYLFSNTTVETNEKILPKGNYEIIVDANSLPDKPINNESAHLIIMMNNQVLGSYYLNEKRNLSQKAFNFSLDTSIKISFSITFDNDLMIGEQDRNVVFYNVIVKKKN